MKSEKLLSKLAEQKTRSKWDKAVIYLGEMLIEGYLSSDMKDRMEITNAFNLLDYPVDDDLFRQFKNKNDAYYYACKRSTEGCQFLYITTEICDLLFTKSQMKKAPYKLKNDAVQYEIRAVYQACLLINRIIAENE